MRLSNTELYLVRGGALNISASFLNAISRTISTLLSLGQVIGSTIRRAISRKVCR